MDTNYRKAVPEDAAGCITLRAKTRQNAISVTQLKSIGITHDSWKLGIERDEFPGYVCLVSENIVGYCFGEKSTGEILVLVILPEYEGLGIGKELLNRVVGDFKKLDYKSLFLGCWSDPASRSYGFYLYLGWKPSGKLDVHQDEILQLFLK